MSARNREQPESPAGEEQPQDQTGEHPSGQRVEEHRGRQAAEGKKEPGVRRLEQSHRPDHQQRPDEGEDPDRQRRTPPEEPVEPGQSGDDEGEDSPAAQDHLIRGLAHRLGVEAQEGEIVPENVATTTDPEERLHRLPPQVGDSLGDLRIAQPGPGHRRPHRPPPDARYLRRRPDDR